MLSLAPSRGTTLLTPSVAEGRPSAHEAYLASRQRKDDHGSDRPWRIGGSGPERCRSRSSSCAPHSACSPRRVGAEVGRSATVRRTVASTTPRGCRGQTRLARVFRPLTTPSKRVGVRVQRGTYRQMHAMPVAESRGFGIRAEVSKDYPIARILTNSATEHATPKPSWRVAPAGPARRSCLDEPIPRRSARNQSFLRRLRRTLALSRLVGVRSLGFFAAFAAKKRRLRRSHGERASAGDRGGSEADSRSLAPRGWGLLSASRPARPPTGSPRSSGDADDQHRESVRDVCSASA